MAEKWISREEVVAHVLRHGEEKTCSHIAHARAMNQIPQGIQQPDGSVVCKKCEENKEANRPKD